VPNPECWLEHINRGRFKNGVNTKEATKMTCIDCLLNAIVQNGQLNIEFWDGAIIGMKKGKKIENETGRNFWRKCEWKHIPSTHKKNVAKGNEQGLSGFVALITNYPERRYCCGNASAKK
jgi:hypothetical protein